MEVATINLDLELEVQLQQYCVEQQKTSIKACVR